MKRVKVVFCCAIVIVLLTPFAHGEPKKATIYRDTWGVPHLCADTWADAAYALGYAQAEDRLEDVYKNVRTAIGTMSEAFGDKYVEQDYILRLFKNAEICEEYWKTAPEPVKQICDNFMRGVEAFVAEHPEKKPVCALELHGWQCAAIGRTMILQWPLGVLQDEVEKKKEAPAFGSNAYAVAPSRCAEGCSILMTDPHLTWEGLAVFYEARLHTNNEDLCGYFLAGSPCPALGHNAFVSWACTTGGPDTSDVYMVKLNPNNFSQYEYNGKWLNFDAKAITINVKDKAPEVKPALYTIYGPLVDLPDTQKHIAYCGATPYYDQVGMVEQMYKMAQSHNCEEFYQAMKMNQLMEQNILFADRDGNIQYLRNGRTPIRPDGYDWSVPVPGGTDATRWLGIHDIDDLVQIKNPPQGYFQNCNVSPEVMMSNSPLTPDKYKKYIYNVLWDTNSPRGRRLLQLLDADPMITKEKAIAYATDNYDILAQAWQSALKAAMDTVGGDKLAADPELAKAANGILQWDGHYSKDSVVAPLFKFWRLKSEKDVDTAALVDGQSITAEDQNKLLTHLKETMDELKNKYGSSEVKWGDITLIGRGGKYFPLECADYGGGKDKKDLSETVMDVTSKETPEGSGKYVGYNGSGTMMISFLHKDAGIESYSLVAWGQSGDPNSPHYTDQSEKLYTNRKMKPTWFNKEEMLQHVESKKDINIP
jgi:acyl-homoserine lactone acylase PvdQ